MMMQDRISEILQSGLEHWEERERVERGGKKQTPGVQIGIFRGKEMGRRGGSGSHEVAHHHSPRHFFSL